MRQRKIKSRWDRVRIVLKRAYRRFLKIRGGPREIALGFALGIFVGMTPTLGVQTPIAIFVAALFKWSKIAAVVGVWITNPFTAPIIYSITYLVGTKVYGIDAINKLPENPDISFISELFYSSPGILWSLTIGGVIIGLPLSVVAYYVSHTLIVKYKEDMKRRIEHQKDRLRRKVRSREHE